MKTLYTNLNTWRATLLAVCSALVLFCCSTANAQTTFGPFANAPGADMTALDGLYNGSPATMTSDDIAVSGVTGTSVIDISVDVEITHTWVGDLTLKLVSPDGDTLTLMSRPGLAEVGEGTGQCCGPNVDWLAGEVATFHDAGATDAELMGDAATPVSATDYFPSPGTTTYPTTAFADLFGGTMNGTWSLFVGDGATGDFGTLVAWSITIITASPSMTLVKTVQVHDGTGDCTDDIVLGTDPIGVIVGDSVCYFYEMTNTGDVAFETLDLLDDQLGDALGLPFPLGIGASVILTFTDPIEILAEVTNIAVVNVYDAEGAGDATDTDDALVGIIPPNDECVNAITLDCGVPTTGTTHFATDIGNNGALDCGELVGDQMVWYTFVGTGYEMELTTCGATTDVNDVLFMAIYDGSCGAFNCIANNNAQNPDPACATANSQLVEFASVLGTTYYVGVASWNGGTIDFDIMLDCAPDNDLCVDAEPITCGQTVSGYTEYGTSQGAALGSCNASNPLSDAPGVWYSFVGDGSLVTLSTCDQADYDTDLALFTGADCNSLVCVDGDDDGTGCTGFTSLLTNVPTVSGQNYYVYVSGWDATEFGAFDLTMTCVTPPVNDQCAGAISMVCGETVSGSTSSASSIDSPGTCTTTLTSSGGVWYSFVGTGESVTVTTCNPGTNFDTKLGVFSGACGSLVCVAGNDDQSGAFDPNCNTTGIGFNRGSTVNFFGVFGTTYHFYVTGFSTNVGDFDLSVSCLCTADAGTITAGTTPVCMDAGSADISATHDGNSVIPTGYVQIYMLALSPSGIIVNAGATPDFTVNAAGDYIITTAVYDPLQLDPGTLPPGTTLADVYAMTQDGGGTMCASVDPVGATFTVHAQPTAVVSGGGVVCPDGGGLVQVDFTGTAPWAVTWDLDGSTSGEVGITDNPYIFAMPGGSSGTLTIVALTDDNGCTGTSSGSAVLTAGEYPVADFTSAQVAGSLDVDFTNASTGGATSWAWDFGDGNTSSDQDPTNTYAAPGVYTVCLIAINDCDADGDTICYTVTVVPANDLCANAESIACGGTATGSTAFATSTGASDCDADGLGVWYTFTGDGSFVTISLDNPGSDYDTYLGLTDVCGGLCVAADDDGGTGLLSVITDFPTVNGQDYFIQVSGFLTAVGNYELTLTCAGAVDNDNVCDAIAIVAGPNGPFPTSPAGVEVGEPSPPAGTEANTCESQDGWCDFELVLQNTTWYTFDAPSSGYVIISTDNSYDTQIAVYDAASCADVLTGGATLLGANDDNPNFVSTQFSSELTLCGLTPGSTYFLQVDGYLGASGDLNIELTEVAFAAGFTSSISGLDVTFTDASSGGNPPFTYVWDFGDGGVATDASPVHTYPASGPYTVCLTVTDALGCSHTYCETITIPDPVSVSEMLNNNIAVYPNPSNGEFVIEVNGVDAAAQIDVMDVTGRMVHTEAVTLTSSFRKSMNLDVAPGSYLLRINTPEGVVTRKIELR